MSDRRKIKYFIKVWVALGAIAIVLGYGAYRAKDFAEGPTITVDAPQDGRVFSESLVTLSGTAHNLSFLTLNDSKIFTDESGTWSERILLSKGYNVLTLKAQDRFGRTEVNTLQLIYQ